MREIKFRAWDKEKSEMKQVQLMDWSDWWVSTAHNWERHNGLEDGDRNSFRNEETDRHILMQYTGLKLNGKEVYEGDIYAYYIVATYNGITHKIRQADVVRYKEGAFYVGDFLLSDAIEDDAESEIIGNKFENPELLEQPNAN